jgi:hypothetical protein
VRLRGIDAPEMKAACAEEYRMAQAAGDALRALAEADARHAAALANPHPRPPEHQGPQGLDPTRFGDWENKGIASDF